MSSNTGNRLDFAGRTAIVTGGSQGIGFGVAERLLASGANISVWAVNRDRLKHAAAKLDGGGRVQTVSADIGNSPRSRPQLKPCSTPMAKSMS